MSKERDRRAVELRELFREEGLEAGGHPSPERLFEYQDGLLTPDEEEEVRDHLALCSDCARMVLELTGTVSPALPEGTAPLSESHMEELWPGMRRQLPLPRQLQPAAPRRRLDRVALPLAASLLLATLATSYWAWSLGRQNRRLAQPQVNVVVRDLIPLGEGVLRERLGDEEVPGGAEAILLVLNLDDLRTFPEYRTEILQGQEGEVLWASDALQRSPHGNFTVQLPRHFLGSGRHVIRLFGVDHGQRELLAVYELSLAAADR